MYARGFFDQAMKCFERSGHHELLKKAQANKYADEATKKMIQIESDRNTLKQNRPEGEKMKPSELSKLKRKLKNEEITSLDKFLRAGHLFIGLQMFKQAGQCFFSGKDFEKAFECFCKVSMYRQAAECLQMQKKYREAAAYYQQDCNYLKVIECLDLVNEWPLIIEKIHLFAHLMGAYEKQALLKKYAAMALQELVYEIEFENEQQREKP